MLTNLYAGDGGRVDRPSPVLVTGAGGRRQVAPAAGADRVGAAPARARRGAVRRRRFAGRGLAVRHARARHPPRRRHPRRRAARGAARQAGRARRAPRRPRGRARASPRSSARSPTSASPTSRTTRCARRAQNPQLMGDGMRRAWEDWLAAECAAHPVLLVLEDLHWGDLGTVSFIDAALRNLRDQPLMVLALARPEVRRAVPRALAGARAADDPPGAAVAARGREAGARGAGRRCRRRRGRRGSSSAPTATRSTWRS